MQRFSTFSVQLVHLEFEKYITGSPHLPTTIRIGKYVAKWHGCKVKSHMTSPDLF